MYVLPVNAVLCRIPSMPVAAVGDGGGVLHWPPGTFPSTLLLPTLSSCS
eukprot:COSAG05_NODE_22534_length_264_cov_0.630303_1_plen_48_part_10